AQVRDVASMIANGEVALPFLPPPGAPKPVESAPSEPSKKRAVSIRWKATKEDPVYGYLIYRAERREGPFLRLSREVVKVTDRSAPANEYRYVDTTAEPGKTYYYYLDSVSLSGIKRRFSGVLARTIAPDAQKSAGPRRLRPSPSPRRRNPGDRGPRGGRRLRGGSREAHRPGAREPPADHDRHAPARRPRLGRGQERDAEPRRAGARGLPAAARGVARPADAPRPHLDPLRPRAAPARRARQRPDRPPRPPSPRRRAALPRLRDRRFRFGLSAARAVRSRPGVRPLRRRAAGRRGGVARAPRAEDRRGGARLAALGAGRQALVPLGPPLRSARSLHAAARLLAARAARRVRRRGGVRGRRGRRSEARSRERAPGQGADADRLFRRPRREPGRARRARPRLLRLRRDD